MFIIIFGIATGAAIWSIFRITVALIGEKSKITTTKNTIIAAAVAIAIGWFGFCQRLFKLYGSFCCAQLQ